MLRVLLPRFSAVVALLLLQLVAEAGSSVVTDAVSEEEPRWTSPERSLSCLLQHTVRDDKDVGVVSEDDDKTSGMTPEERRQIAQMGNCDPAKLPPICNKDRESYREDLVDLVSKRDPKMEAWFSGEAGDDLLKRARSTYAQRTARLNIGWFREDYIQDEAWKAFETLRQVDAREVLAFQETWTDEDTEMLRALTGGSGGFTEGNLTSEKFKADLPSISFLEDLTSRGSLAIVGAGPSVRRHGQEIDSHDVVARFNNHVGKELNRNDTGVKLDVHVMNWMIYKDEPSGNSSDAQIIDIDLESTTPGYSYCKRWRNRTVGEKVMLAMRPSAWCGLFDMWGWTRGFLFYWLVGRLFETVDMYGMSAKDSRMHLSNPAPIVGEQFLSLEHLLYTEIQKLQEERDAKMAKMAKMAEEQLKGGEKVEGNASKTGGAQGPAAKRAAGPAGDHGVRMLQIGGASPEQSEEISSHSIDRAVPVAGKDSHSRSFSHHLNMYPWPA